MKFKKKKLQNNPHAWKSCITEDQIDWSDLS